MTWKKELPSLPDISLDKPELRAELESIADSEPILWRKIAEEDKLWEEGVMKALFPTRENLRAVLERLKSGSRNSIPHRNAYKALQSRVEESIEENIR